VELRATRPFRIVDVVTAQLYPGNPAVVLVLDAAVDATWMQVVAMEFNLAETAFVQRRDDGAWRLRWFTPVHEVRLCGHATPAAAHVLWTQDHESAERKRASARHRSERRDWAGCGTPKSCGPGRGSDGALANTGSGDPRNEGMVLAEQVGGEGRH
jgi:hypothetical protein